MSGPAWSPLRLPDVSDPSFVPAGPPGVVIAPFGIDTLEAFGALSISNAFGGNFAALVAGATVLTCLQPDKALVEDTTLLHTAGTGPVLTFTGTRSGAPTPIWVTCDTTGGALGVWQYKIYYNGLGTGTPDMTGTSASTIALTGAGAGLTLNIAAGTAVTTDVWKATCATGTDQGAGAKNWTGTGATNRPIIGMGPNSKPELLFDGSANALSCLLTLASPATTPVYIYACFSVTAKGSNQQFFGDVTGADFIVDSSAGALADVRQFNGGSANSQTIVSNTRYRMIASFTGSTADSLKFGSNSPHTGQNAGVGTTTKVVIGAGSTAGSFASAMKVGLVMYLNAVPSNVAALDAAVASYWSGAYAT